MVMLNAHMQAASSNTAHHFSSPFLISYIVVMTSPSSQIVESTCIDWQGSSKVSLCAFIFRTFPYILIFSRFLMIIMLASM